MVGDLENFVILKICRLPSQIREISIPHYDGNFYKTDRRPRDADASGVSTDGLFVPKLRRSSLSLRVYRWSRFRRCGIAKVR
jgi:hypothetical protein